MIQLDITKSYQIALQKRIMRSEIYSLKPDISILWLLCRINSRWNCQLIPDTLPLKYITENIWKCYNIMKEELGFPLFCTMTAVDMLHTKRLEAMQCYLYFLIGLLFKLGLCAILFSKPESYFFTIVPPFFFEIAEDSRFFSSAVLHIYGEAAGVCISAHVQAMLKSEYCKVFRPAIQKDVAQISRLCKRRTKRSWDTLFIYFWVRQYQCMQANC